MAKKKTRYQGIQEELREQEKRAEKIVTEILSQISNLSGFLEPIVLIKNVRLIFLIPTAETSSSRLKRGLPIPVKNALEIAIQTGTEKIVSHKDVLPLLQAEFGSSLRKEAFISWDQIKKVHPIRTLTILGHPEPSPDKVWAQILILKLLEHLKLLDASCKEIYSWLPVLPLLQAVKRLRWLGEDEEAIVFIIDRHATQLEHFLLPLLGSSTLSFPISEQPRDTYRKAAALKTALTAERGKEKEAFVRTYLDLARRDGISRQARWAWLRRFLQAQQAGIAPSSGTTKNFH